MRVLCVDQFSNWGGGQRSLLDLLPAFAERGWQPHVLLPGEGPFAAELRKRGHSISFLPCANYTSIHKPVREMGRYAADLPRMARSIQALAQKIEATLLYINGPRVLLPAAWVSRRAKIPLVFHCHHFLQQSSSVILTGAALQMSGAYTIASCRYAVTPIKRYVRPDRLFVSFNGVAGPDRRTQIAPAVRRIGVIGRIESEKGQLEFVHAVRLIAMSFPAVRFGIVGSPMFSNDSYYRSVVAAAKGLPIDFMEWQHDLPSLFGGLDLVVVPSGPLEATTRVIMEAFAFGVPVVAFPSGGIPEILTDGENGYLASGVTPAALGERMSFVLNLPASHLESVAANGRNTWRSRFTLQNYRQEVCDIVSQAGKGSRLRQGSRPPDTQAAPLY